MGPEFMWSNRYWQKTLSPPTAVASGVWGYSVLIGEISATICSSAMARRWSVYNVLQNLIKSY